MPGYRQLGLVALIAVVLGTGCARTVTTCGTARDGGGPPILATREDEVCEVVRWRVLENLRTRESLSPFQADSLYRASESWGAAASLDELRQRVAGDGAEAALAEAIVETARTAWSESRTPPDAACDDEAMCTARAAAHGARVALRRRHAYVRRSPEDLARERARDEDLEYLTR